MFKQCSFDRDNNQNYILPDSFELYEHFNDSLGFYALILVKNFMDWYTHMWRVKFEIFFFFIIDNFASIILRMCMIDLSTPLRPQKKNSIFERIN